MKPNYSPHVRTALLLALILCVALAMFLFLLDLGSPGDVISALQLRKGNLTAMDSLECGSRTHLCFSVPTRGLVGFKNLFAGLTQGEGIINRSFTGYGPYCGDFTQLRKGALVSMAQGKCTAYALNDLQVRGTLFVKEGDEVYPGMVIGESNTDTTLRVNPAREKKLSNVRSKQADEKMIIQPPRYISLEESIGYIQHDECIEVTPTAIRLRKTGS